LSADGARRLHALAAPGAAVELVFSYDPARDAAEWRRLGLDPCVLEDRTLERAYALAGWHVDRCKRLPATALRTLGTTWASKLALAEGRLAVRLTASAEGGRDRNVH
jgi:hypothetical protein